jgi:hypothetical protein
MVKYIEFEKASDEFTTHEFRGGSEDVIVTHFSGINRNIVKIESDDASAIDSLISNQAVQINCTEVQYEDIKELIKKTDQVFHTKRQLRDKIRGIKDLEDDLTDLKKTVQFMARGFAGLWASLPQDMKDANPYKDNFDLFTEAIVNTQLRLDLETDQVSKIAKILNDEAQFAQIVNDEYLSKV